MGVIILVVIIIVLIIDLQTISSLHLAEIGNTVLSNVTKVIFDAVKLREQKPGLGTDFIYYPGSNGTLQKIELKYDNETVKKLQTFYDREKELQTECDKLKKQNPKTRGSISFKLKASKRPSKYNGEKFDFNNDNIKFTFYNRNYTKGIKMEDFSFKLYNITKKTKVVTHGFLATGSSEVCISMKNNYLNVSDVNVIVLDWSHYADNIIYPIPAIATGKVADYCASFIGFLFKSVGVKEEDLHMIGHSLGAHVVGFCGKRLLNAGFKNLTRCTGLDPALPLFSIVHIEQQNCNFVDIIHTSAGSLGIEKPLGHIDFYPDGGDAPQSNCTDKNILTASTCSHSMSWKYYADSILNNSEYIASCNSTDGRKFTVPMGEATPAAARGICKLRT